MNKCNEPNKFTGLVILINKRDLLKKYVNPIKIKAINNASNRIHNS